MPLYEIESDRLNPLREASMGTEGIRERQDLQRLLRDQIGVLEPGLLVIAEEFGEWDASRRRIDLLAVDEAANLVVVELKRDDTGGHMDLQALRYAAMVSTMTFDRAVSIFEAYLTQRECDVDAEDALLDHLGWEEAEEEAFGQDVRILLAAADFGKELTTAVLWLNQRGLDIKCVRLRPYADDGRVLLNVEQVIPLPEAEEFQVRVREKAASERQSRTTAHDYTRFDLEVGGRRFENQAKRTALFEVVRHLVSVGVTPETVYEAAGVRRSFRRVWLAVEGEVDAAGFEHSARAALLPHGKTFDPGRWYAADDELLHVDGRTYAFTKMWGGRKWWEAMEKLEAAFPQAAIDFRPV